MTEYELTIKELSTADSIPYSLLHLADPSKEAVEDYLSRGTCYVAFLDNALVGEYVILPTRPFTYELVNLAVDENHQNRGIGKLLINHAIQAAKSKNAKVLEVGTGNCGTSQLALYQKCGFTISWIDFDFFTKHYEEKIVENGMECRHMVRLRMDL